MSEARGSAFTRQKRSEEKLLHCSAVRDAFRDASDSSESASRYLGGVFADVVGEVDGGVGERSWEEGKQWERCQWGENQAEQGSRGPILVATLALPYSIR